MTKLIDDIKNLNIETKIPFAFSPEKENACNELVIQLIGLMDKKVKRYASYGFKEARLFEFKFGDELKIQNFYAKELLERGNVIEKLQNYLNNNHSHENEQSFYVYFTMIGKKTQDYKNIKYGIFVNWDKSSWDSIQARLNQRKERSRKHFNKKIESV
jgi:hypothetical protein